MTDLSHDATDDGFHEIQLSGKQLVFLFMATTVVSVVIFLCGVLVGRGVRGETLSAAASTSPPASASGPTASLPAVPPSDAPAPEPLTYKDRLESEKAPAETLSAKAETPAAPVPAPVVTPPPPVDAQAKPQTEATAANQAETKQAETKQAEKDKTPQGTTGVEPGVKKPGIWAVQVVALTDQAAANAVVQRLSSKGYPAFLVRPQPTSPVQNYKVQVGKFEDRSQAEQVAGRLKREEQFQPWILR